MLSLEKIKNEYPIHLRGFHQEILREYLQYIILQILFDNALGKNFCFWGGTCLRIVHGTSRFSEDLDFDNFSISPEIFDMVKSLMIKELEAKGFKVEVTIAGKNAFRLEIKFIDLLYDLNLTGYKTQKLLIQLDSEAQNFKFIPNQVIINKFGVFTQIQTTPIELILSQKFYAILNRPRNKGRDFYDVVYILGTGVRPNYDFLEQKIGIDNEIKLKERILEHCSKLDMEAQALDVSTFLFDRNDMKMVRLFTKYLDSLKL